ncbi:CG10510 [Drosophila busckii]|uniref:Dynein regulatory complex subunit 2 n=1 Tax=Drosophila busckii TaxID=30019 RepID=A0A0M4F0C5_DROBS|nr:dynein regulatory complex subunit 2 [Drosophila busckii]ALC44182.1 CG10510 [Drosophila busckii]
MSVAIGADGLPEVRVTRITETYLQDALDEEEVQGPPKLTKKEKKAMKKEAKRLQEIEDRKLVLRDDLRRELELGRKMEVRGMDEWSAMCEEVKLIELRQEIVIWGERSQRIIDAKNDHINMLLDDMAQTQEQHSRSFGKTVELIDHISNCYHAMLDSCKRLYERQVEDLLKEFYDEVHLRTEEVENMHNNSENIIHATNILTRDQLKLDYTIYLEQRDDCVNREIENRFQIRDQVVNKMSEMQHQLNTFVDSLYNTDLDANKYERIRQLTERQAQFVDEVRKLNVEEMKCLSTHGELQRDILRIETEDRATINDLRLEHEYFTNVRKKIEERMYIDRHTTHEKLRILTSECYALSKRFEKIVKGGELLLALSITCRKLQTESEKIIVGGEIVDDVDVGELDDNFTIETLSIKDHVDITEEELVELNRSLKNFWRQQGMAQAQNLLLLEEKHQLTEENQGHIDFIKSMSKTDDAETLRSALSVSYCDQPTPFLFDTECRGFKVKVKQESATPGKDAKHQANTAVKHLMLGTRPSSLHSRLSKHSRKSNAPKKSVSARNE